MSPPRTSTADLPALKFTLPSGPVELAFTSPQTTTAIIPPHSHFAIPLHWHEKHTEIFRVKRGFLLITIGTRTLILGPDDPSIDIPPFTLHGFSRADTPAALPFRHKDPRFTEKGGIPPGQAGWEDQDVVLTETATPSTFPKQVFFRNAGSFYRDFLQDAFVAGLPADNKSWHMLREGPGLVMRFLEVVSATAYMDNYPLFAGSGLGDAGDGTPSRVGKGVTYAVQGVAKGGAWLCGWPVWSKEYTPENLWVAAQGMA